MNTAPLALIHSTESFGSVDGPGVRYVVFMQGCKMRCLYCHNPDTWLSDNGKWVASDELLASALRYKAYWGKTGGITVSGGEPLLQLDFLIDFFKKAKEQGVHTVLDTSGNPFTRQDPFYGKLRALMQYTDLVLLDIKHIDPIKHKSLTGYTNENILEMALYLSQIQKPVWIRYVLVPGITDNESDLKRLRAFTDTLNNVERVEVLPYHSMGEYKWRQLGIDYKLKNINPPDKSSLEKAKSILES